MEHETFFSKLIQEKGYSALLLLLYVLGLGVSLLLYAMQKLLPGFDTECTEIGNWCLYLYQLIFVFESHVGAVAAYALGWDISSPVTYIYMALITAVFYMLLGRGLDRARS